MLRLTQAFKSLTQTAKNVTKFTKTPFQPGDIKNNCISRWNGSTNETEYHPALETGTFGARTFREPLTDLRLGEHVQTPGAEFAVSRHRDEVVRVLGAHHFQTVNWVLPAERRAHG